MFVFHEMLTRRREFQNWETPDVGAISEYVFTRLHIALFVLSELQQLDNYFLLGSLFPLEN